MKTFEDKISYNINHFSEQYNKEFNQKISSFISLGIENQYDLSLHGERDCRDITIELLLQEMLESNMNRIALLGGPGAGKSTLLLKMAILLTTEEYNLDSYIPVLIKCGLEKTDEVENLIHISGFSKEGKKQLLEEGRLFLIFDGINEVSNMEINDFLNKIYLLSEDYPECKYIVSCRSLEFPVTEYNPFEKYTVLPVTDDQISNNLIKELGEDRGKKYFSELCHSSKNYLLDICRTPLLLSLVINILSDPTEFTSLEQLRNKSDIYKHFYKSLIKRQRMKNTSTSWDKYFEIRDEILRALSYYMQGNGLVYIEENELIDFVRNMKYFRYRSLDIIKDLQKKSEGNLWYLQVVDALKKSGFLNTYYDESDLKINTFAFIHQSFQEYFAGCFLSSNEKIADKRYTIFLLQQINSDNNSVKPVNVKRNWTAIEFASNQDSKNRIISYIMRYSQKQEDSNALELAAHCILQDATENKHLVDDCCIWLLEAFKYWNIPYKYNLIYVANSLLNYVSQDFPERLKKDIMYFGKKYTGGYTAIEYPESFDFDFLKKIIQEEHLNHKLNAIFTLGERNWTKEKAPKILEYLFSLIDNDKNIVREQVVKSIKSIIEHNPSIHLSDEKLSVLVKIIQNKEETGAIRTYTLNAVATTGDTRAIPIFMDYLKDKENPYRDSASWSLQELVLKSSDPYYSKDYMKQFYYECLVSESDDEDGMYSKGNLVYTLSKLSANDYVDKLKRWIVTQREPYVQEDGINAIGVLAGINEVTFIDSYTTSFDPVIRSKAIRSLLKIDKERFWKEKLEQITNDKYSIVSYIADEENYIITETLDELLEMSSENNIIHN